MFLWDKQTTQDLRTNLEKGCSCPFTVSVLIELFLPRLCLDSGHNNLPEGRSPSVLQELCFYAPLIVTEFSHPGSLTIISSSPPNIFFSPSKWGGSNASLKNVKIKKSQGKTANEVRIENSVIHVNTKPGYLIYSERTIKR